MMHIDTAVLNNILWCGIVCEMHGLTQTSSEHVWGLLSKAPEFYPDIITSSKHATSEEVKDFEGKREVVSIKDSFANLDMVPYGFKILFEAKWVYHTQVTDVDFVQAEWTVVTTEKDLAQWVYPGEKLEIVSNAYLLQTDSIINQGTVRRGRQIVLIFL